MNIYFWNDIPKLEKIQHYIYVYILLDIIFHAITFMKNIFKKIDS